MGQEVNVKKLKTIENAYWELIYSLNPTEIISYIFDIKIEGDSIIFENAQTKLVLWDDYNKLVDSMYILNRDGVIKIYVGDSNFMVNILYDYESKILIVNTEWTPKTGSVLKSLTKDELLILVLKLLRNILLKEKDFIRIIKHIEKNHNNTIITYKFKLGNQVFDTCTVWRFLMIDFSDLPQKLNNIIKQLQTEFNLPIKLNFKIDCIKPEFVIPNTYTESKTLNKTLTEFIDNLLILTVQKTIYDKTLIEVNTEKVKKE